jgi:tyrosyl-tRNA synthetase
MNKKLSEELSWRGFVNQTTLADKADLDTKQWTFYWGVDPSSDSMTIGNLAAGMMVKHFINAGHKAILLVGGATGAVGDPDGKSAERELLSQEQIDINKRAVIAQYNQVFDGQHFEIVDNSEWFGQLNYVDFLREVGKHVPMRTMLSRDFVQSRLSQDGSGISYAEFSYSLIQGYDFLHLHRTKGVDMQVCGSDQWGNSIAGVDLTRRVTGDEVHIWTAPLIVDNTTGIKFGKSEAGAVWLDPDKTSVYKFYQFWLNVDDGAVIDYLKIYTMLPAEEIEAIKTKFNDDRGARLPHKTLAYEVTKLIHGELRAVSAQKATEVLFGSGGMEILNDDDITLLTQELPYAEAEETLIKTIVKSGLAGSNSEATRLIENGAVKVNSEKKQLEDDANAFVSGYNLLKVGKNNFAVVKK